jgi:hypothetical protein
VDKDCWFLDGDTGTRSKTFMLNDDGLEWSYIAIFGDKLFGSAQLDETTTQTSGAVQAQACMIPLPVMPPKGL